MTSKQIFLIIIIVYLVGYISHALFLKKTVYGDGIYYYSWLRSLVIDRDINFDNEYKYFNIELPKTNKNYTRNIYSPGPSFFWLPFFLFAHSLFRGQGYELQYQLIVGMGSIFYAITGLILLYRLFSYYYTRSVSLSVIISLAFATNLIFYGSVDPVNSHALSFFAASLFLTLIISKQSSMFLIGFTLGIIGLLRPLDLLYGILLLGLINRKTILTLIIGFIMSFSPQLLVSYIFYGIFINSTYLIEGFGFPYLSNPKIFEVLYGIDNGLLLWTPIVFLGIIGLVSGTIRKKLYFSQLIIILLLEVYFISSWVIWWQGASYSGRMFVGVLPIIGFGLGHFFQLCMDRAWNNLQLTYRLILPLSILNILLIALFLYQI